MSINGMKRDLKVVLDVFLLSGICTQPGDGRVYSSKND